MKVSVIIPTYNRSDLLSVAVKSVLNQTYKCFEVIVIDDESTDDTKEVMEKLIDDNKEFKIKYIINQKGGANKCRNRGIEEASGEYLAFLDDDDEWRSNKLEKQIEKFKENNEYILIYTGNETRYIDNNLKYYFRPNEILDSQNKILFGNFIGSTSSVMIKKEKLGEERFDEKLKMMQDYDLWIRLCQKGKIGCLEEDLLIYNNRNVIKQISDNTNIYIETISYINKKYDYLYKSISPKEVRCVKYYQDVELIKRLLRVGKNKEVRKLIIKKRNIKLYKYFFVSYFDYINLIKIKSISTSKMNNIRG